MKDQRRYRAEGDSIIDLINDMICERGLTGTELALATGKSEAQISFILNPLHQSQWTLTDLPVLMRMLDGEKIAWVICSLIGMVPSHIPHGPIRNEYVFRDIGKMQVVIADAIKDGKVTTEETEEIKMKLRDVIDDINALTVQRVVETKIIKGMP